MLGPSTQVLSCSLHINMNRAFIFCGLILVVTLPESPERMTPPERSEMQIASIKLHFDTYHLGSRVYPYRVRHLRGDRYC
jgi:hypothetical protein